MEKDADDPFTELIAAAEPRLWKAFVGVRGEHGADEALSEAMVWAWEHRARLVAMTNPVGYLYRVGITRSTPPRRPDLPHPGEVGVPEVEPGLVPALLGLPERQRTAVWLVHACEWNHGEAAEALGVSSSTVATHVARALASLRRALEVSLNG